MDERDDRSGCGALVGLLAGCIFALGYSFSVGGGSLMAVAGGIASVVLLLTAHRVLRR